MAQSKSVSNHTTPDLSLYILTFNCGRTPVQPEAFAPYLFSALRSNLPGQLPPELLVLCLQELAPISYAFLGGSFLTPYLDAWNDVVKLACKDFDTSRSSNTGDADGDGSSDATVPTTRSTDYVNIVSRNLGLTAIMVFARTDVVDHIGWIQTAGVGLGVSDMGNKGAVGARLGYKWKDSSTVHPRSGSLNNEEEDEGPGEVQLTFVAAHLAAMEDALEQRNEDYKNIVQRLVFVPETKVATTANKGGGVRDEHAEDAPLLQGEFDVDSGPAQRNLPAESGIYSAHSHLFFAGDLNYRTSLLQPSPLDVQERFPQPTSDETDPKHFKHLLAEDQLTQQVKAGKALHGLTEAPIDFPPTYKYDPDGSKAVTLDGEQPWPWARHRWPSWCDRIFFWQPNGDVQVRPLKYTSLPLFASSDHRPVALAATVPLKAVSDTKQDQNAPFTIDPEWKGRRAMARRKELVVGLLAYLALTREGNGLLAATTIGAVGGWLILRSLLLV
ncbi:hypothetical protein A1O1_08724 [Capronia coronata CBS 617.96]|uniref:Inositol polyphosphate-related phosphatase domain-containing protein n=1 Tax=Capronia coronata CBS 617.96 TaxID=1182541 RepID=W9XK39_9EURO|nr:uncharacterized protein A1O1_08724 [Capronia coronata CBS 617.96]EXJ80578.1 hypothetical protein A1O1_08724 [Capronia coronata CBS 617.96]